LRLCERFSGALTAFQAHQWQEARALFDRILADWPDDGPARFYAMRCEQIMDEGEQGPDADVIQMEMK
jgi:hypothetical protein